MEEKIPQNKEKVPDYIKYVWIGLGVLGVIIIMGALNSKNNTPSTTNQAASAPSSSNSESQNTNQQQTLSSPTTPIPSNTISKSKSLTDIIAQWRKSTAYIECDWVNPNTHIVYLKQSGSGLLFMMGAGDVPTVITNKHVVSSSQYGIAQECAAVFPGDKYAFYAVKTVTTPTYNDEFGYSIPENTAHGQIVILNDKYDVAYLTDFEKYDVDLVPPAFSLEDRAVRGNFSCASEPNIGDPLVILGYPSYGSGAGTIVSVFSHLEITATEGIISGKDNSYYTTSAKIEHGNSGGLAIDKNNNCYLGIPTAAFIGEVESLGRILPASVIFKY